MLYKAFFKAATGEVQVLASNAATPGGFTVLGTFEHQDHGPIGSQEAHVLFQHVQELLYKAGEQNTQRVSVTWQGKVLATDINVTPAVIVGIANSTLDLSVVFTPADPSDKRFEFSPSDDRFATVTKLGKVTFFEPGVTFFNLRTPDGRFNKQIPVEVKPAGFKLVASITVPAPAITLTVAAPTFQLVPTVLPADATTPALKYTSSDPTKATVSASGLVTRVANGATTITIAATDGSGKSVTKAVTVTA